MSVTFENPGALRKRVENLLKQDDDALCEMNTEQFYGWCTLNQLSDPPTVACLKAELLKYGIDSAGLRPGRPIRLFPLPVPSHRITLYVGANFKTRQCALTDEAGSLLYCGPLWLPDAELNVGPQVCDVAAAKKAARAAELVRKHLALPTIELRLFTDASFLTYANLVGSPFETKLRGGRARVFAEYALTRNVCPSVRYAPSAKNPGKRFALSGLTKKWDQKELEPLSKLAKIVRQASPADPGLGSIEP